MENRKSRELSRQTLTGKPVKRDKDYYLNNLDIEKAIHETAISLAERMFTAFIREKNIEVSVNVDDIANKIISKLGDRLVYPDNYSNNYLENNKHDKFSYDDGPVIIKTDKIEIKGQLAKAKQSDDSIEDSLDILKDLEI
ncbi:MAG: hypothetical protein PHY47_00180 [Lachnospiraceae bacterium]|nr:hypothetical protein [Lachnospiraceae bacterium]